jgi:hypothetical protein
MVGFANISDREMLYHLFLTYGSITPLDLEHYFEHMRKAWDPQQPVETLFKKIKDWADYAEAGEVAIVHAHHINVAYAKIFATYTFTSACRRWNEKETAEKTWLNFKFHFATVHRQHNQMQGESAANSGYHVANSAVGQTEDHMAEATIGALDNLATATATDRGIVAILTEANARLPKQLKELSNEVKEVKALLKKEKAERKGQITFNPSPDNYCWSHGYKVAKNHTSQSWNYPKCGNKCEAINDNNMRGSQANKEWCVGTTSLNNSE